MSPTITAIHSLTTISLTRPKNNTFQKSNSCCFTIPNALSISTQNLRLTHKSKVTKVRSVDEEDEEAQIQRALFGIGADAEEQAPTPVEETPAAPVEPVVEQTVTVPVSASDKLVMCFEAEGSMTEAAIPAVEMALQGDEGISDLNIWISEGVANVQLTKETTIQATGVASGLLETIQGAGFRLQTLTLNFKEDDALIYVADPDAYV